MMTREKQDVKVPTGDAHPFAELLSGTAFQAHPMDAGVPLAKRFAGKSVILLMTTRERAATLRVEFEKDGRQRLHSPRQIAQRSKGELVSVLRAEARACKAEWVVVSLGSGWQAQYSNRSLRGGVGTEDGQQELLLRNDPGLFLAKPAGDCLYAAVDHPVLDRAVVFSVKRREVESLAEDVREAGLGLAAVRVGMAALLESWFERHGAGACQRDLLVSDGLGVLLVAFERGDFSSPAELGTEAYGAPRQYSNRPGDIAQDIARLNKDNVGRELVYVGPAELEPEESGGRLGGLRGSHRLDPAEAIFAKGVRHEFHPYLELRRAALSPQVRQHFRVACWSGLMAWVLATMAFLYAWNTSMQAEGIREETRVKANEEIASLKRCAGFAAQKSQGLEYLQWLKTHPDAQRLLLRLLEGLHENVALERLSAQVDESGRQMVLEFHLLGSEEGQEGAVRSVEQALLGLGYRIGERNAPVQVHRGTLHRWRLIIPPAFEEGLS